MGVPISGPSCIYGDNMSKPESMLKKKSAGTPSDTVRESVAMSESTQQSNPTDLAVTLATKVTTGQK